MKTVIFVLLPFVVIAQLKVHTTGNISVKSESTPRAFFDIPQYGINQTIAQFGSFGIQSISDNNGFLTGNAYWDGSSIRTYVAGKSSNIQFFQGNFYVYNYPPTTTDGQSVGAPPYPVAIFTKYDATLNTIVGINTTSPANFNLSVNGTAYKSSGGADWAVPSDRRLKTNIRLLENANSSIDKINIYEFEYNGNGGTTKGEKSMGVIAQELIEIFPEMVKEINFEEKDGTEKYLTVESGNLIYVLIAAFKEQKKVIEQLASEITQIKAEINFKSDKSKGLSED